MKRPSLRWLMLIPTLVTMTFAFAAFAVYIDGVEQASRLADVDDELIRAQLSVGARLPGLGDGQPPAGEGIGVAPADDVTNSAAGDVTGGTADGVSVGVEPPVQLVVDRNGQISNPGSGANPFTAADIAEIAANDGVRTVDDPRYRVRVVSSEDGSVAITALSLATVDAAGDDFRRTLFGGGLLILVLAGVVIWLLTMVLVRPVIEMAATATRVADGELDTEIDPPRGGRETATLANDLQRMVGRLRDTITDRELAAAEATEARNAMQRFLADVSHELRTPLTALKGYSDLYAGHMLDEPGALERAMGRIGDESDRLARMVNDMLRLARHDLPATDRRSVDVCHVAEAVIDDLRAAYPECRIELMIDDATDAVITASPGQVHQALLNLGANACLHTEPDTSITFEVGSSERDLVVRVIDHGPGIDPDEQAKIFRPFYRSDDSRSRQGQGGAGLGLAVVERIVREHGGAISLDQTPGGGATFTLGFPRVD